MQAGMPASAKIFLKPIHQALAASGDGFQDRLALQEVESGLGSRHAGLVVVEGAALGNAVPDDLHDLFLAAKGCHRIAVAEWLWRRLPGPG